MQQWSDCGYRDISGYYGTIDIEVDVDVDVDVDLEPGCVREYSI